jgi:DNA-binding PadR family transcriptional regulator
MDRDLFPGEYALLGLLLIKPMHGYEMARYFEGDDLTAVCPIEQSSLYTYLRTIEARGLVAWEEERVGQRPPRKRYQLTETGRAAVMRWLAAPVGRLREIRLDFLLKLYFLRELDPAAEQRLLAEQIAVVQGYLARMEATPTRGDFQRLVLGSKRSAAVATLDWLQAYGRERQHTVTGAAH